MTDDSFYTGSDRLISVPTSGIRRVSNEARRLAGEGHDVISFSTGEPDFRTPSAIVEATVDALRAGFTHYAHNWGEPLLRQEVAKKVQESAGISYDPGTEILITCGGTEGITDVLESLVNPGDEVLILNPAFLNYEAVVRKTGGIPVTIDLSPTNGYAFTVEDVETRITGKTKLIVLNNPNNPTGAVYPREILEELAGLAVKYNLWVFTDEMYSDLVYGDTPFCSMIAFPGMKERTLLVSGFSKTYAMTGWRLGYIAGPRKFLPVIVKNHQYLDTCLPTFIQIGVAKAMNLPETKADVAHMVGEFKKRRDLVCSLLRDIPRLTFVKPEGAFYVMIGVEKTGLTGEEFSNRLLHESYTAVVPGTCFGAAYTESVRLSFATSEDNIRKGLGRIKKFVETL